MTVEGEILWQPSAEFDARSNLRQFMNWLGKTRNKSFADYMPLHHWSVSDPQGFWSAIWDYFDIQSDTPYSAIVDRKTMPGAQWFAGSRVNYAEHMLRGIALGDPDRPVTYSLSEVRPDPTLMTWRELATRVRRCATALRGLGIEPGDRIVSYMPNVPETLIAMMATVAVGAVWSSAAPEFGTSAVVDRFVQIEPKLIFACDGYRFNGKNFDRTGAVADIVSALPSVRNLIFLPYLNEMASPPVTHASTKTFSDLMAQDDPGESHFRFTRVPHDHPLWILFSSGTTGLPKAIVHSHVGMLLEHQKSAAFAMNMGPGQRQFFYTTTGWMMWNALVSVLLRGASIVLYDGSPTYPEPDFLWKLAAEAKVTSFGASPTFVQGMQKLGIQPKDRYDLSSLESILLAGSPALPETFAWFYTHVKSDLWLTSQSGGTELCGGIVGAAPILPVKAGEIQCPVLGVDAQSWTDDGQRLTGEVGELVITNPTPHMPIYFWNDKDGRRYHEAYFDVFPGVWRHGDFIKINADGGSIIYGRSDSTLNRHGVRIGTAEIYRTVDNMPEVADSLVVCIEPRPGHHLMPLFVMLKPDATLDDALANKIKTALRETCSPRHVPDQIFQVPAIPYTLSGKKMEVPVRKILDGAMPEKVASRDSMSNPAALDAFVALVPQFRA